MLCVNALPVKADFGCSFIVDFCKDTFGAADGIFSDVIDGKRPKRKLSQAQMIPRNLLYSQVSSQMKVFPFGTSQILQERWALFAYIAIQWHFSLNEFTESDLNFSEPTNTNNNAAPPPSAVVPDASQPAIVLPSPTTNVPPVPAY